MQLPKLSASLNRSIIRGGDKRGSDGLLIASIPSSLPRLCIQQVIMQAYSDIWLPDGDDGTANELADSPRIDGRTMYQFSTFAKCLPHLRGASVACDIGAGAGLWSLTMAGVFDRVIAFEHRTKFSDCHKLNCNQVRNVSLRNDRLGSVDIRNTKRLDRAVRFRGKSRPHLIRISTGSHSAEVVKGAERIIKQHEPCVLVNSDPSAINLLEQWGMVERWNQSGMHLMLWNR